MVCWVWLGSVDVGRKSMFEHHRFCGITMAYPSAHFRMDGFRLLDLRKVFYKFDLMKKQSFSVMHYTD